MMSHLLKALALLGIMVLTAATPAPKMVTLEGEPSILNVSNDTGTFLYFVEDRCGLALDAGANGFYVDVGPHDAVYAIYCFREGHVVAFTLQRPYGEYKRLTPSIHAGRAEQMP